MRLRYVEAAAQWGLSAVPGRPPAGALPAGAEVDPGGVTIVCEVPAGGGSEVVAGGATGIVVLDGTGVADEPCVELALADGGVPVAVPDGTGVATGGAATAVPPPVVEVVDGAGVAVPGSAFPLL